MRNLIFCLLFGLGLPLQAQETSSFHIDLSLYRTTKCLSETSPLRLHEAPYNPVKLHCHLYWQPVPNKDVAWETSTTAWYTFSSTKQLGIELNFTTTDRNTTLKLRGRRILFEWRW